jgi:hypothetical protein
MRFNRCFAARLNAAYFECRALPRIQRTSTSAVERLTG